MLAVERGASANTLDAYERDLEDFISFLRARDRAPDEAQSDDLRAYLTQLSQAGLAARTVARRLSALRQYHRFLYAEGWRSDDPTTALESPRQGRSLPKPGLRPLERPLGPLERPLGPIKRPSVPRPTVQV